MIGATAPRNPWSVWLARLAGVALALQAFLATTHFEGPWLRSEHAGTVALLALIVAGGARWRALAGHPLPWLVLAFIAYVVLESAHAAHLAPALPFAKQISTNAQPVRVGILTCVIGAWLAKRPSGIPWLLGLMVAGFMLEVLAGTPWLHLEAVAAGALRLRLRSDYPQNLVGEYAAMGLLLLSLYTLSRPSRGGILVTGLLGLAGALLLACLLYAQSRAAWLAALLVPLAVIMQLRDARGRWRGVVVVAVAVAVAVLVIGYTIVVQRVAGGEAIARALVEGDFSTLPSSSVTVRVQLVALGLHTWLAHPLLGIGLRNIEPLIAASGIHIADYVPPHLHNGYLQTAVGLGGVGVALLLATFVLLVRDVWRARRAAEIGSALYLGLLGSLGIILVVNLSDCLFWHLEFLRAPLELLLGCCFAISLRHRAAKRQAVAQGERELRAGSYG